MGISERTLRKWRREALSNIKNDYGYGSSDPVRTLLFKTQERILKMTQELLDQHLLRKGERK